MDVHADRGLAARQEDLVATSQLAAAGWSPDMVRHRIKHRDWRRVHRGVYVLSASPLTPGPALACRHPDGAWHPPRPRKRRCLLGLPPVRGPTGARTLLDLAPNLSQSQLARATREALRIGATTPAELHSTLARNPRRRGRRHLADLTSRYAHLPYRRARSNAEARALEVLHEAMPDDPPALNLRVAGEEADLVWHDRRLIIEIDGPGFHRFAGEDARKQRAWERAGYTVRRLSSDDVYDRAAALVALAVG